MITQVTLTGFRGATQPVPVEFPAQRPLVVLYGENGTGKSTILDAIDAVCNQEFGSIAERKGVTNSKHIYSVNGSAQQLRVQLKTRHSATDEWEVRLDGARLVRHINPAGGQLPRVVVLRRGALSRLVEAAAADQYKEFQRFIDVSGVEEAEKQLNTIRLGLERTFITAQATYAEAGRALNTLWDQHPQVHQPGMSAIQGAQALQAQSVATSRQRLESLRQVIEAIARARADGRQWFEDEQVAQEMELMAQAAQSALNETIAEDGERRSELAQLLAAAASYLGQLNEASTCPLCANDIELEALRQRVNEEQKRLEYVLALTKTDSNAQRQMSSAKQQALRSEQRATQARDLLTRASELAALPALPIWTAGLWNESDLENFEAELLLIQGAVATETDQLQTTVQLYDGLNRLLSNLTSAERDVRDTNAVLTRVTSAQALIEDQRRQFIQGILDDITTEVNRLYGLLHPGEQIDLHRLVMDPRQRASVKSLGNFLGTTTEPPQAYFSQSHLDTLGFCIWLALAKRQEPSGTVLLLDDVFTSVDGPHFDALTRLLESEASATFAQIIVSTHSPLLHKLFKQFGSARHMHILRLEPWTLAGGVTVETDLSFADELGRYLIASPFEEQTVSAKAGVLLERVFNQLTIAMQCAMVRSEKKYTLDPLLTAVDGKLSATAKVRRLKRDASRQLITPNEWEDIPLITAFTEIKRYAFVRNMIGCHDDEDGGHLSPANIRPFGQATFSFVDTLTCRECGRVPHRRISAQVYKCKCNTNSLELHLS